MLYDDNYTAKHNAKDSVFTNLFSYLNNVVEAYKVLHPEDSNVTEDDIQISTLSSVIVNHLINDLGFFVKKNGETKFVILVEEQSQWNPNITCRLLGYLCETLKKYVSETKQRVHGWKRIKLPEIELYVIYAGDEDVPDVVSFRDDFFDGNCPVDLKVKIIKDSGTDTIISQYIGFCKVLNEQKKIYGDSIEVVKATIRICIERGYLADYLIEHSKEVVTMMAELFDENLLRKEDDIASREEARNEGRIEGIAEGKIEGKLEANAETALNMLKKNLSDDIILDCTGISAETLENLKKKLTEE